ncbi:MAG: protease Lon-related BREX system protein BrxL [Methanomassiliicoccaceae archaeon]|nr:protease Lon-related BREX system protein BrxL [Methanomassiliicoccaceae archaeon]
MDNNATIVAGFNQLLPVLSKYVTSSLYEQYGDEWWNVAVLNKFDDRQKWDLPQQGSFDECVASLDIARVIILLDINWNETFRDKVVREGPGLMKDSRSWAKELLNVRNKSAHIGGNDFSDRDARRALDTMERLCECFDKYVAKKINVLYESIGRSEMAPATNPVDGSASIDDPVSPIAESVVESNLVFEDVRDKPIKSVSRSSDHIGSVTIDVDRLTDAFDGCIVRKDLTKKIKEGANVPIFVLEYLLGMHCSSSDQAEIDEGLQVVKKKLARLYIRPDEAERIKSNIREAGEGYSIIDKVSVTLDFKKDIYVATFLSLGLKNVPIDRSMVVSNPRLLSGGIWCIITFNYSYLEDDKLVNPFKITRLSPIQMPFVDVNEFIHQRKNFTKDEWIALMLRSTGIEPDNIDERTKWLLLARIMPLVENNINVCELGPRSTGKSHVYKEISPSSILVSGGQASVASLFYNMSSHTPGLVCNWDVVAFDEVAEIKFKDKDAITIMKDYMASGSFSRGGEQLEGKASMVFVGNINENINTLLLQASLFKPFPVGMNEDTAFLDRFHCYIPGWEIEPFSPRLFTNDYGFICDYFAEISRELRKMQYSNVIDKYFTLDESLKQRDVTSIKKTVSAMMKIIYPNGVADKGEIREILEFAMEMRSRVKEQLKRIQPDGEFSEARFIYHDLETEESREVFVPECEELSRR